ncbi:MAG TPA: hypothetical protein VGL81_36295 [Polyangiaceae bacterium]|jgi:hypothetical protein
MRTGPERFWAHWPVRLAFAACLLLSGLAHCAVVPFGVPHGFEMNDTEGEAAIPIDILEPEDTPPPPPPPPPENHAEDEAAKAAAAALLAREAGAPKDAGADASRDAGPDAASDAAADGATDASGDAPSDGGAGLDGAIALADAGPGARGPKDPQAILGAAGDIQADVVLVMVVVNAEVIRTNAVGAKMGYLLRGIPQWDEFMSGTDLDPVRDTDWVMISGPSLVNTSRDVILIHYSAPDAAVDKAVDVVSKKYDRGGRFDAGVPGVRASLAHADRAERVILRPQSRVLAVVPTNVASKVARQLVAAKVPAHIRPGEALYLRVANPHHPMPEIPETITEMRLRVVPRPDQGADLFLEGDTKDAATASQAAEDVKGIVKRHNDWITSSVTHGLLDGVDVTTEGSVVHAHLTASRDQIETLVALVGDLLGIHAPSSAGTGTVPRPAGSK